MKLEDALREMRRVQEVAPDSRCLWESSEACVRTKDGESFAVQVTTYGEVWAILETPEAVECWIAQWARSS